MSKIKKYRGKSRIYTKYGGTAEQVTVLSKKDREREKEARETRAASSEVEVPEEIAPGKIADSFGVSFREGEFVIDFFKTEKGKLKLHTRIITAPAHLKRFAGILKKAL